TETASVNVTNISGVPTWTLLLIQRVVDIAGKKNILEVWPDLEVFFHGAVSFKPYRSLFQAVIPDSSMRYWETYNASEGFFGIQDRSESEEMLLMLDYGIFYEFMPADEVEHEHLRANGHDEVELGKNYAMIITTTWRLWRYNIKNTIKFTSLSPYRIRITGRTKHFMNAFGEEVIVENAELAITRACEETGSEISNFTAAPIYLEEGRKGSHEWIIEFKIEPPNLDQFTKILDRSLRDINSDYDAKRSNDLALILPTLH